MADSFPTSVLNVDLQPGKPPVLRTEAAGDVTRWAAEHRNALRAFVAEHGSLLVRGLGLRDVAETEAVFRQLGSLVAEREAFAPRRRYSEGVYSASKWPPNQHMCVHHELSYALEPPGLMLFACLVAPPGGGETPVADSPNVLSALPADLVEHFERVGWLLIRNYNEDIGAYGAGWWSPESTTTGKSPSEVTAAACAALTGNVATCCPRLMKFFGCDQKPRTIGTIGAGSLRISPAMRSTVEETRLPKAFAAARPKRGEPFATRARQNRTIPSRASQAAMRAYRNPTRTIISCSGVGFSHSSG